MNKIQTFHITLENPTDPDVLRNILKTAGINVKTIQDVTQLHDGYALTNTLAKDLWERETGQSDCAERNPMGCERRPKHTRWETLDGDQKREFMKRYVQFLEDCREEELQLDILLQKVRIFRGIALTPGHH